jgi:hypothetical protein
MIAHASRQLCCLMLLCLCVLVIDSAAKPPAGKPVAIDFSEAGGSMMSMRCYGL